MIQRKKVRTGTGRITNDRSIRLSNVSIPSLAAVESPATKVENVRTSVRETQKENVITQNNTSNFSAVKVEGNQKGDEGKCGTNGIGDHEDGSRIRLGFDVDEQDQHC